MTDLEITKRCAEKMGITGWLTGDDPMVTNEAGEFIEPYDPRHNDAQCMAMVKKIKIEIAWSDDGEKVRARIPWEPDLVSEWHADLNSAVCECVANMP